MSLPFQPAEFYISVAFFQSIDKFFGFIKRNEGIGGPMKSPYRNRTKITHFIHIAATAKRDNCSKFPGIIHGGVPCSVSPEAHARNINPVRIDPVFCHK